MRERCVSMLRESCFKAVRIPSLRVSGKDGGHIHSAGPCAHFRSNGRLTNAAQRRVVLLDELALISVYPLCTMVDTQTVR